MLMRVLTVDSPEDYRVLRQPCKDFTPEQLSSKTYRLLAEKMVATVTSPEQDGVGIAGPQVGISRRIVAVQRLDKEGSPFEVYPNIRIICLNGPMEPGPEGCLSVPGKRGSVLRYRDIFISYTDPASLEKVTERVEGFTAVIFQHECDHLDGILYTDKLDYKLKSVLEVAGRQGVAADADYYYVSSSTALYKYNKKGRLVKKNENPFTGLTMQANHFGDIDVYNGEIYTGIEIFQDGVGVNIQVGVYDAATLQYKYSIPWVSESGQVEVCGLAVDRSHGRVWMADWVQGHELYCYDIESRKYIGKIALDPAPKLQQGIFCLEDGRIVISCDDGDADSNDPDHLYICNPYPDGKDLIGEAKNAFRPASSVPVSVFRTMDDFLRAGEIEGLCFDAQNLLVLSNRGSRIVLGMVKGFYPGYDHEIHELYVYSAE